MPEVFGVLDDLVQAGKLRHYGVSVERVQEAIRAAEYPNVQSVQIIFNMFRPRPAEEFFPVARERRVGILARVPLASDGSFAAADPSPAAGTLYRAVYREPTTGLPYAFLLRAPVG
jgi:aryl-alcohol dehydrogenase-like predicted oxidoreductase